MIPSRFRSSRPSGVVRAVLVAEVALFMAAAAGCLWLTPRNGPMQWYHLCLWVLVVALPVCANLLHGDRPADSGLRLDNIVRSGREVLIATSLMGVLVAIVGLAGPARQPVEWCRIARDAAPIFAFAIVQQYAMQAFILRRLQQSGIAAPLAVSVTVACFGLMHMPNLVLTGVTMVAALVWCTLFMRQPNLFTLGASHCLLTLLVRSLWPRAWHLGLAIGPKALERAQNFGWW